MDIQKERDFTSLPEIANLYQACKERDLTIAEREYLKGARDAWKAAKAKAVPEGFVVLKICDVREIISNASDAMGGESPSAVFIQTGSPSTWYDYHLVAERNVLDAIEARESTND